MADDIQNQKQTSGQADSPQLEPVKSPLKKVLSAGAIIIVGGVVVTIVGPLFMTSRVMGASRTARLKYEQKKAEIQQQLAEEVQKEIDEKE